jgi:exosome complex RNA-binding protein Rrp42 (RNase PH superfamily)
MDDAMEFMNGDDKKNKKKLKTKLAPLKKMPFIYSIYKIDKSMVIDLVKRVHEEQFLRTVAASFAILAAE